MSRFYPYSPEQGYLVPPHVAEELGSDHLCFFIRKVVSQLDLKAFTKSYSHEGGQLYAPELMLSVWLYAYATGMTSARRLSQRLVEDLALRYLSAGARVDNWALSAFRRRHALALNDAFTQVLEMARKLGLGKLGRVAIDSTRIKANASRDRVDTEQRLRNERAKLRRNIRRWQQACDQDDSEPGGLRVAIEDAERKLAELPRRLERLRKSGLKKRSRTDEDARFLRTRRGFELGYTGELAMSEDHLVLAERVTQEPTDNASLAPMVERVKLQCGSPPEEVLADSGYFSVKNLEWLEEQKIKCLSPRLEHGAGVEPGEKMQGQGKGAGAQAYAAKATKFVRKASLFPAQDHRRARLRGIERAARHAPIPYQRKRKNRY